MGFFKSFFKSVNTFFDRVTTITPKSFTPANIIKTTVAAQVALYTGGGSIASPKIEGVTLATSDTNKAGLLDSAYVGASSLGTVRAGDPAIPETQINKIARLTGATAAALSIGSAANNVLFTSPTTLPAGVQGPVQPLPLSAQAGNIVGAGINTSAVAFGTGNIAKTVLDIFGPKTGSAIIKFFSGDIGGGVQTLTSEDRSPNNSPYTLIRADTPSGYGGGGGGGGRFSDYDDGTRSTNTMLVGAGMILLLLVIGAFLLRRKG